MDSHLDSLTRGITAALSDAGLRLSEADEEYSRDIDRYTELEELFEALGVGKEPLSVVSPELLQEYLELNNAVSVKYERAVYLQGMLDAVLLLLRFGWLNLR